MYQVLCCEMLFFQHMTTISYRIGKGTIVMSVIAFFVFPGLIMFTLKSNFSKDVEHKCCACGTVYGKSKRRLPCM